MAIVDEWMARWRRYGVRAPLPRGLVMGDCLGKGFLINATSSVKQEIEIRPRHYCMKRKTFWRKRILGLILMHGATRCGIPSTRNSSRQQATCPERISLLRRLSL